MSSFNVIIDRFEGDQTRYAILELPDLSHIVIPAEYLPEDVREGDCLTVILQQNIPEREKRRSEIIRLQEELTGDDG